ncbi:hypothetical protein ABI59_13755 [Acidobacteria bacterium Mor1]|nr:hypothetical protein ABI59_13755 [Acidobacteria bacterium Mor1]
MRLFLGATALLISAVSSAIYPSCDTFYVETWPSGNTLASDGAIRLSTPIWRLENGELLKVYPYADCDLALRSGDADTCLNLTATYLGRTQLVLELRPDRPLQIDETYRLKTQNEDSPWDSTRFGDHGEFENVRWTAKAPEAAEIQWAQEPRIVANNYSRPNFSHSFGPRILLEVNSSHEWLLRAEISPVDEASPPLTERLLPSFVLANRNPTSWDQARSGKPERTNEARFHLGPHMCGGIDLKPGRAYRAQLTAVDIFGNESEPRELVFFTPPEDPEVPVEQQPGISWVEEQRWRYHVAAQTLLTHDSVARVEIEPREFERFGLRVRFKSPEAERVFLAERKAAGLDPEWISVGERHSIEMVPLRIDRGAH